MKVNIHSRQIVFKGSLLSKVSQSLGITRLRLLPRIILTLAFPITGLLGASGYVPPYQMIDVRPFCLTIATSVGEAYKSEFGRGGYRTGSEGVQIIPIDIGCGVPDLPLAVERIVSG